MFYKRQMFNLFKYSNWKKKKVIVNMYHFFVLACGLVADWKLQLNAQQYQ